MRRSTLIGGIVALACACTWACASGERFGATGDGADGGEPGAAGCTGDLDCWDGDPNTRDVCLEDGSCRHTVDGDPGTGADEFPDCPHGQVVEGDGLYHVGTTPVTGALDHTLPLARGGLVRLLVKNDTRLRVVLLDPGEATMVLLDRCLNAAPHRLGWGDRLYSATLEPGEYFLGVFSRDLRGEEIEVHYLEPTPCATAEELQPGTIALSTLHGKADDFSGSCAPPAGIEAEHRGDRVFRLRAPEGAEQLRVELAWPADGPPLMAELRDGCAGAQVAELACVAQSEQLEGVMGLSLSVPLTPGADPHLIVDSLEPDRFDEGLFMLGFLAGAADR